jgi:uncharacterized metal-binding protein
MADGQTHARIASGVTLAVSVAALPVGVHDSTTALAMMAGAVCGWLMTPDLDIEHRTHEEWRLWRLSPVIGAVWTLYWLPYAWAIPHRHWLSHAPGIGTLIRMLYVGWWIPIIVPVDLRFVVVMWLAWCVQDIAHLAADGWRFHS